MIAILLALHALAAVIWVGGMFFALLCLRPALAGLAPPDRLRVWRNTLPRFFAWVWASIAVLLASGYYVVIEGYGGFAGVGQHVHIMHGTGLLMVALFVLLNLGPFRRFRIAYDQGNLPEAGKAMLHVRTIVIINLALGLITVTLGGTGVLWG